MKRWLTSPGALFWWGLLLVTWALSTWSFDLYKALDARWIIKYPAAWRLPMESQIQAALNWLMDEASFGLFTFREFTRGIAALIEAPYDFMRGLLIDGFQSGFGDNAVEIAPSLSWIAVIVTLVAMAHFAKDWRLSALVGACFAYLAVFGQWESAMMTLASVLIAVPIGALGGLALGILAFRHRWVERALRPILDLMQTVPVFAYLVPILILFGFGPVAALVATVIYAMPPMVRITILALQGAPSEIVEVGRMTGCTKRQMMWKLLVPSALPTLMVGVNQVIMLTLNMVIIASMIGAGGLRYDVLTSLRRLDIGGGVEVGLAIVVMAIALDRLSQAFADRASKDPHIRKGALIQRHPWLTTVILVLLGSLLLGLFLPPVQRYPEGLTITTGPFWSQAIEFINVNFFETFETIKTFFLTWFLLPVKRFFSQIPWPWGIVAVGLICWRVAGWKLALIGVLMTAFIAVNGLWAKAMVTIYLCGASVVIATLIGIPLGVLAAENPRAGRVIGALMDTLQTLPSFVYLIPVVMLFRVGDFSAMIAVILLSLIHI